jgi:predicted nucleotidyltransferase
MRDLIVIRMAEFFFENPYQDFYLRELAKKLKISPFATKKYADLLIKESLIKEERKANLRYFRANMNSLFFRQLKIAFSMRALAESGLMEFLKENLQAVSSITLFGSMAKGEDDQDSDVDLLIIGKVGKDRPLDTSGFEDKIGKRITTHVFSWSEWNRQATGNKAFYSDVISHGMPLYGERPIVLWK